MPMSHLPVKTETLFGNDQGHKVLGIHQGKFELHKRAAQKRKPPLKPVYVSVFTLLLALLVCAFLKPQVALHFNCLFLIEDC